jgi:oligosaccharide repeat unit polymerase
LIFSLPSIYNVFTNFQKTVLDLILGSNFLGFNAQNILEDRNDGIHVFSILAGLATFLSPFILMYYLTLPKQKTLLVIGLFISSILDNFSSAATGARGEIVFNSIILLLLFSFFSRFMVNKIKRNVIIVFGFFGVLFVTIFIFLTFYKFSTRGDDFQNFSTYNYASQCFLEFNNHGLNAGGVRYGTRTATLITSVFDPYSPSNYAQRVKTFNKMKLNESNFSTFVGDFTLDYGPYFTIIIFILFYFVIKKYMRFQGNVPFYKLIPIYFFIKLFASGWTLFAYSNFGGNLKIIILIITYFYFRHDYLRQKRAKLLTV